MKHMSKAVSVFLALALLLALLPAAASASAAWTGAGDGSADDPYQIGTKEQLAEFRELVNGGKTDACAVLTANIDLGGSDSNRWTPIGSSYSNSFTGVFDGEGHTISGLYVNGNDTNAGLFGYIGDYGNTGAIVKDLRVSGSVATESSGGARAGGIAGTCYEGTVQNCAFSGPVSAAGRNNNGVTAGGVVGSNYGTVSGCEHRGGTISATSVGNTYSFAGGVVGYNSGGTVENCANIEGAVTATKDGGDFVYAGGVVGDIENGGTVSYCFSAGGPVTAENKGNTGSGFAGGVVGNPWITPTSCYYLAAETSGQALSAADFKVQSKFVDWDFTKVWIMGEDRPMLRAFPAEVSTWTGLQTALQQNGAVQLTENVTHNCSTDLALLVPSGKTVTLDLNGHTIDRGLSGKAGVQDGYVIMVAGNLTVTDSSANQSGTITGGNHNANGGGVVVNGTFTMNGGAIRGNKGGTCGGVDATNGVFQVSGAPVVSGNFKSDGTESNVYLPAGRQIGVTGALDAAARFGVTMGTPGVFTGGLGLGTETAKGALTNFFSDDGNYYVAKTSGGEATLEMDGIISYKVTFRVSGGKWNDGTDTEKEVTLSRKTSEDLALVLKSTDFPAVGAKPDRGYQAGSWSPIPQEEKNISADETYTYTYEALAAYTITLDANGGKFAGGAATKAQTAFAGDYVYTVAADAEKPVRSGHSFRSWTLDKAGETPLDDAYTLSGDTTLYAQWTENAAPVDYDPAPAAPKETRFDEVDVTKGGSLENFKQVGTYTPGMFADAGEDDWYMENLKAAVELGILEGLGDGTFGVGQPLKLSETLAIACRLHNLYYGGSGKFDQTKDADWYAVYADYAAKYGIAAKGQYDLTKPATRAQFAAILAAALPDAALTPINAVTVLPDMAPDDPRLPAILKLYNAGILTGVDAAGSFAPDAVIPREQVAAMATRVADPALRRAFTL